MDVTQSWSEVADHAERLKGVQLRALLDSTEGRVDDLVFQLDDLSVDLSREKLDVAALRALVGLAEVSGFGEARAALFSGDLINNTEQRAALHMALRGGAQAPPGADVEAALQRFLAFAEEVRSSDIADVVSIGIGGSDLGPAMAARALAPDCDGPELHFVANADAADFNDTVKSLNPASTLVIVVSKTFTTAETMRNAALARKWLGSFAPTNMVAVSTNLSACDGFGIPADRVFGFWDWVGGRYSIWSSVGLSLAIGIGAAKFRSFLAGAASMDVHFRTSGMEKNIPLLLALTGIWRRNFMGWPTVALVPFDHRLARFPAFVQQLSMESNGKSVRRNGNALSIDTAPVLWGEPGTPAQHSFFQLLHQGTEVVPVDLVAAVCPRGSDEESHRMLLANCVAQAEALARGRTASEVAEQLTRRGLSDADVGRLTPHRTFPGDRPSTLILHRELTPFALGRLIAMYEHKVFCEAVIWGTNPFDQWGVELGKEMATDIGGYLDGVSREAAPASLAATLERIRALQA